jgi:2-dehydro-3-deoxyphosphogalactonate aldolase
MDSIWLRPLPLIAILRGLPIEEAVAVGSEVIDAGFRILEVPLNSPRPLESIRRLADAFGSRCLVGAGTVLKGEDVDAVADSGGRLIVTPHTDVALIDSAKRLGLRCVSGAATPTEAVAALRAGADAIKVFPAEQINPKILRAWRAVLPRGIDLLPVGGITPDCMEEFVRAGATGFGIGSALYEPGRSAVALLERARRFIDTWHSISTQSNP